MFSPLPDTIMIHVLASCYDAYISRSGDFCGDRQTDKQTDGQTDCFTPCACAQGDEHFWANTSGDSAWTVHAGHIPLHKTYKQGGLLRLPPNDPLCIFHT